MADGETIESYVPARLDRMPWSSWHCFRANKREQQNSLLTSAVATALLGTP